MALKVGQPLYAYSRGNWVYAHYVGSIVTATQEHYQVWYPERDRCGLVTEVETFDHTDADFVHPRNWETVYPAHTLDADTIGHIHWAINKELQKAYLAGDDAQVARYGITLVEVTAHPPLDCWKLTTHEVLKEIGWENYITDEE